MRYARDNWTKKDVEASDAVSGGAYSCPVCRAPVILRSGYYREAYFAHKSGMGSNDCDLYYPGGQSSNIYSSEHALSSSWGFNVNIETSTGDFPRSWGLTLTLPYREGVSGELEIDVGGRNQRVLITSTQRSPVKITAEPQTAPYIIKSINLNNSRLESTIVPIVQGLRESGGTAFGEANFARANTTSKAQFLSSGGSYLLVWNASIYPNIPAELSCEPLKRNGKWDGAIIELPISISPEGKQWLEEFAGLPITPAKARFIPIWPPTVRSLKSEFLEAPSKSTVMLFANGTNDNGVDNETAFIRSGENTAGINVANGTPRYFRIKNDGELSINLALRNKTEIRTQIEYLSLNDKNNHGHMVVELQGKNTEDGQSTAIQMHDLKASDWLLKVRNGAIQITSLVLPLHARGSLSKGRYGLWNQTLTISPSTADSVTSGRAHCHKLVPLIANAIKERAVDIKLDFGGFGRAVLPAEINDSVYKPTFSLSLDLKQRLRAYLAQLPSKNTQRVSVLRLNEQQLIQTFLFTKPTAETAAIYRYLAAELNQTKAEKGRRH